MVGSSGALMVTVNETTVYQFDGVPARAYAPGSEVVRCNLVKGRNRVLVFSRQGAEKWSYGIQIAVLGAPKTDENAAVATGRKD